MKYMLLVYSPENAWTKEEWFACTEESLGVCRELAEKGEFISAAPLHPVATALSVRVRQGKPIVTSGPFAETVEQLGGYFLIDVTDLDRAIEVALRLPSAKKGTIEVRPIFQLDGLPTERFELEATERRPDLGRFMFLCYDDEEAWKTAGADKLREAMQEAVELTHRLANRSQFISASPLEGVSAATSVRIREGKRLVSDGPFAETREFLGGFYLILARDINEAASIAAQHSGARVGTVEVRRVFEL